jgi:hypothetical protein
MQVSKVSSARTGKYTIKGEKIDRDSIKWTIVCDKKAVDLYKELTDKMENPIRDDAISIEMLKRFLEELERFNDNERLKSDNAKIKLEIISMLKNSGVNSEFSLKIYVSELYMPNGNVMKPSLDIQFDLESICSKPIGQEISIEEPEQQNGNQASPEEPSTSVSEYTESENITIDTSDKAEDEGQIKENKLDDEDRCKNTEVCEANGSVKEESDRHDEVSPNPKEIPASSNEQATSEKLTTDTSDEPENKKKDEQETPKIDTASVGLAKELSDTRDKKLTEENQNLKEEKRRLENEIYANKQNFQKILNNYIQFIKDNITKIKHTMNSEKNDEVQKWQEQLDKLDFESFSIDKDLCNIESKYLMLLEQLVKHRDSLESDNSELKRTKSELEGNNKKLNNMLESFHSIYVDEENKTENISDRLNRLKEQLAKGIGNVNREALDMILYSICDNVDDFYALKKWSNLRRLEDITKNIDSMIQEPGFERFTIAIIKGLEKGITENQIDWEVTAQFLVSRANDYINNKNDPKDIDPLLDSFLESLGFSQINPGDGFSFNSREHDVDKVMATQGYTRGQIVNTVKRGLKRADRVIQKALVNIAQ